MVFVRAIDKVLLRDESFVWVRESKVFAKLREVGVFSYFGYFWSKSHSNGMGFLGP